MKIEFKQIKLGPKRMTLLEKVNIVLEDYARQGYVLTLRQLYYRLVTQNVIPNRPNEYAKLSDVLTEGRLGGIVDWNSIEDRVRVPKRPYTVDDIDDAISDTVNQYRLDRQLGQKNYVEMWTEKDAISNILYRQTAEYGIPLLVNRGYSSTTAMYESYKRMERAIKRGQVPHVVYFGDHDPSGLDMALRDIPERLNDLFGTDVVCKHIGITMPQIEQFDPPPNPAKITDPRAKWYIGEYGDSSWEVDALEPKDMHDVIHEELSQIIDLDMFEKKKTQEEKERKEIALLPDLKDKFETIKAFINQTAKEYNDAEDLEESYRPLVTFLSKLQSKF
jgi:hypothetical protein